MPEQMPKISIEEEEQPEEYLDAKPGEVVRARFPEGGRPKDVMLEGFQQVDGEVIRNEKGLRTAIVRIIEPKDPQYGNPEPLYISEDQLEKIVGLRIPSEETAKFDPNR